MHEFCLSFIFNCPLIAYFLKKNYSLRQNIFEKKNWGFERGHSHQSQLVFIWIFFELGLDWEQAARRILKIRRRSDRTLHRTLMSSVRSVHRRWTCCEGVTGRWNSVFPASGQKVLQRPVDDEESRLGDRTLAASGRCPPDTSGRDSRRIGPLWNRLDAR